MCCVQNTLYATYVTLFDVNVRSSCLHLELVQFIFTKCFNFIVCLFVSLWSKLQGKKRVPKAEDAVKQNVVLEKETKENNPATNRVSIAPVCCI